VIVESEADVAAFAKFTLADAAGAPKEDAPPTEATRVIKERPDLRPTAAQGVPLRTSRAPTHIEVAEPAGPNAEMMSVRVHKTCHKMAGRVRDSVWVWV
jgi:hypothetical protein